MAMEQTNLDTAPLFSCSVSAGFPSPADDYMEKELNLHELMVKHPAATFFFRASGDSMIHAGINNGDILVIDRSLTPRSGNIIVAEVDGDLTVKQLYIKNNQYWLLPMNPQYPKIRLDPEQEFAVFGVVTYSVHKVEG
ncbi:translesion error-prone DNA polymerase V autoproteolytic subunit [Zooshikella marina]|uniref:LexA family protein n=1 Tax=Zooshikella ganghwensis TaxID=202772 RepID=UPI001BAF3A6A|nr:translesion error-prone DNA polymerase V autoproteolytic subunit [Zooshikella ganghwensis]MBU2709378.1 translesion error-prone DNA polymerase V autoproteolytic subunit [Zooshikella ganghwensis]